mgnify:CR=1 FL=1
MAPRHSPLVRHPERALARRRYVEDRLMTVASRLGTLADIAIDLEQSLLDGTATERETGLLVRLYSKVGDPVSASEIIDEFLRTSGGDQVDALQEKARVYLSCGSAPGKQVAGMSFLTSAVTWF